MNRVNRQPSDDEITPKEAQMILRLPALKAVYRLFWGGYIAGRQPSPKVIWLSRASVQAHKEATARPGFWRGKSLPETKRAAQAGKPPCNGLEIEKSAN